MESHNLRGQTDANRSNTPNRVHRPQSDPPRATPAFGSNNNNATVDPQSILGRPLALPWSSHKIAFGDNWKIQTPAQIKEQGTSGTWDHGVYDSIYAPPQKGAPRVDPEFPNRRVGEPYPHVTRKWIFDLETLVDDHLERIPDCVTQKYYLARAAEERKHLPPKPNFRPKILMNKGATWCTHLKGGGKCRDCMTPEDIAAIQGKRRELAGRGFYGRHISEV